MPRIDKTLPSDRADYGFGDLIYWHFFVYGTRPNGDPAAKAGRLWTVSEIRRSPHITERSINNWISERHLPDSTVKAEKMLFGDNPAWDDARLELAEALRKSRARKKKPSSVRAWLRGLPLLTYRPAEPETSDPEEPAEAGKVEKFDPETTEKEEEFSEASLSPENDEPEKSEPESRPSDAPVPAILRHDSSSWRRAAAGSPPSGHADRSSGKRRGGLVALLVTAATVALGFYAVVLKPNLHSDKKEVATSTPTPPEPGPPPPDPAPDNDSSSGNKTPTPPEKDKPKPVDTTPPPRTEEQQRADEEQRLLQQTIEALKAAHRKAEQEKEEEAKRRDQNGYAEAKDRRDREWTGEQVAGMGFRLFEYNSVSGTSLGHSRTETVTACALSCLDEKCAAFAWYRDERPSGPRACYRYAAPVTFYNHTGFTAGEKVTQITAGKLASAGGTAQAAPLLAQATPPPSGEAANGGGDGVTRCPTGPVKVTGFELACDTMLAGGTTLGSNRLSWTVRDINECARKCQPIKNCVGFTFNASEQGGHSCTLFGPTPEAREVPGWVSGTR